MRRDAKTVDAHQTSPRNRQCSSSVEPVKHSTACDLWLRLFGVSQNGSTFHLTCYTSAGVLTEQSTVELKKKGKKIEQKHAIHYSRGRKKKSRDSCFSSHAFSLRENEPLIIIWNTAATFAPGQFPLKKHQWR